MDFSFSDLNINSVVIDNVAMLPSIENLLGLEAHAVFFLRRMSQNPRLLHLPQTTYVGCRGYLRGWGVCCNFAKQLKKSVISVIAIIKGN